MRTTYHTLTGSDMVRVDGIEPTTSAWKADVLPLNYTRDSCFEEDVETMS